jgi:hypothetical protein
MDYISWISARVGGTALPVPRHERAVSTRRQLRQRRISSPCLVPEAFKSWSMCCAVRNETLVQCAPCERAVSQDVSVDRTLETDERHDAAAIAKLSTTRGKGYSRAREGTISMCKSAVSVSPLCTQSLSCRLFRNLNIHASLIKSIRQIYPRSLHCLRSIAL